MNAPLNDPYFVRSRICNNSLANNQQMFRVKLNQTFFYENLCSLNDTNLVKLVQFVSSSIDIDMVKSKV